MLVTHPGDAYPKELLSQLQDSLAILTDIDAEFDGMAERLEGWPCTEDEKVQVLKLLGDRRELQRQPHVQRQATLHDQMLAVTLYLDLTHVAA